MAALSRDEVRLASLADAEAHVHSLIVNQRQLASRLRLLEKMFDTKASPWWKRLWWRLDGWPAWYRVGPRSRRPWHRGR